MFSKEYKNMLLTLNKKKNIAAKVLEEYRKCFKAALESGLKELGLDGNVVLTNNEAYFGKNTENTNDQRIEGRLLISSRYDFDKPYQIQFFKKKKNGEISKTPSEVRGANILFSGTLDDYFKNLSDIFSPANKDTADENGDATERDCIKAIKERLKKLYSVRSSPSDFQLSKDVYIECRKICAEKGCEDEFDELWKKACFEYRQNI